MLLVPAQYSLAPLRTVLHNERCWHAHGAWLRQLAQLQRIKAWLGVARVRALEAGRPPSKEISQQVGTLLYAAWLWCSEVPELEKLSTQLKAKYGAAHARDVIDNKAHHLHERVIKVVAFATSSDPPDHGLVECYLEASAAANGATYTPNGLPVQPSAAVPAEPVAIAITQGYEPGALNLRMKADELADALQLQSHGGMLPLPCTPSTHHTPADARQRAHAAERANPPRRRHVCSPTRQSSVRG